MAIHYTISELRDIIAPLAREYGAERVYLFGSYARGDMTDGSDIDLRIDKGQIRGLALAGLLVDLEDALGLPVDFLTTASLDERFLDSIHNDEVLLYEASWQKYQYFAAYCNLLRPNRADCSAVWRWGCFSKRSHLSECGCIMYPANRGTCGQSAG